jgi:hypothetical protein
MWTLPYSTPQKAGVIALGLLVGALTIPITAIACTVLGTIVVLFVGPGRDAWGGFFVAGCFLYGFWLGNSCRPRCLLESVPFSTARA